MVLNNLCIIPGNDARNISINNDIITSVNNDRADPNDPIQLTFQNAIAFPGIINSHDHLEFNLYPQFGNNFYSNYVEWSDHVQKNYRGEIEKILKIPDPPITVIQPQSLHSVKLEKWWKLRLNNPLRKKSPCVIHTGEGVDENSEKEIDKLLKWNLLKRDLVAVHGVSMNASQAEGFKALVWCPASNYFLLNRTAPVDKLKMFTKICFGSDSTLSSSWNLWEHLLAARESHLLSDAELFDTINKTPAEVWKLNSGSLIAGKVADIVIARKEKLKGDYFTAPGDILW